MYQPAMTTKTMCNKLCQNPVAYNNKHLFCIYTSVGWLEQLCIELQGENVKPGGTALLHVSLILWGLAGYTGHILLTTMIEMQEVRGGQVYIFQHKSKVIYMSKPNVNGAEKHTPLREVAGRWVNTTSIVQLAKGSATGLGRLAPNQVTI